MPVRRKSRRATATVDDDIPVLVRLWLSRMLVTLGGHQELFTHAGLSNDLIARVVGLKKWIDSPDEEFSLKAATAHLRRWAKSVEHSHNRAVAPHPLGQNVQRLAKQVGLSDVDCRILEFVLLLQSHQLLDDAGDWLGDLTKRRTIHVLSVILSLSKDEVAHALTYLPLRPFPMHPYNTGLSATVWSEQGANVKAVRLYRTYGA